MLALTERQATPNRQNASVGHDVVKPSYSHRSNAGRTRFFFGVKVTVKAGFFPEVPAQLPSAAVANVMQADQIRAGQAQ
jgi:hypothetical protein